MFHYLKGTTNMRLFHPNDSESDLMGYVYACYFTYSHNVTMVDHNKMFVHMW